MKSQSIGVSSPPSSIESQKQLLKSKEFDVDFKLFHVSTYFLREFQDLVKKNELNKDSFGALVDKVLGFYKIITNNDEYALKSFLQRLPDQFLLIACEPRHQTMYWIEDRLQREFKIIREQHPHLFSKSWNLRRKYISLQRRQDYVWSDSIDEILRNFNDLLRSQVEVWAWKKPYVGVVELLKQLKEICGDPKRKRVIANSLIFGRFCKKKLGLSKTLIIGDDGGLYILLNSYDECLDNILDDQKSFRKFIESKRITHNKIIIGAGGFGKVRLGLNLLDTESGVKAGSIVCIKKSSLRNKNSSLSEFFISLCEDHLSKRTSRILSSPQAFDVALTDKIQSADVGKALWKGYIVMELYPQESASEMFKNSNFQTWRYQSSYILELLKKVKIMVEHNLFFSDLKPANTLFNPRSQVVHIIDLGSTLNLDEYKLSSAFNNKEALKLTRKYSDPKLFETYDFYKIDGEKAMIYAVGTILASITRVSDVPKINLVPLTEKFTDSDPKLRPDVNQAIMLIRSFNKNYFANLNYNSIKKKQYIKNLKQSKFKSSDSSSSSSKLLLPCLHLKASKNYADLLITKTKPVHANKVRVSSLNEEIKHLIKKSEKRVLYLFGQKWMGSSAAMSFNFWELVNKWKPKRSMPVPVYVIYQRGKRPKDYFEEINKETDSNLSMGDYPLVLFIDTFYDNLGKEILDFVDLFMACLARNSKIIVSLSSFDYDKGPIEVSFSKRAKENGEILYVAPINYNEKTKKYYFSGLRDNPLAEDKTIHLLSERLFKGALEKTLKDLNFFVENIENINHHGASGQTVYEELMLQSIHDFISRKIGELSELQAKIIDSYLLREFCFTGNITSTKQNIFKIGMVVAGKMNHLGNLLLEDREGKLIKATNSQDQLFKTLKAGEAFRILKILPLEILKPKFSNEVTISFRNPQAEVIFKRLNFKREASALKNFKNMFRNLRSRPRA